jgi:hypothetical protein
MKAKTAVIIGLLSASTVANAANKNPLVESQYHVECKIGGCLLMCTSATGTITEQAKGIKTAVVTQFTSGTVRYDLHTEFSSATHTVTPGAASCSLSNIRR